jgi:hypothetical protein
MRKLNLKIYNFLNQNGILNTPLLNDQAIRNWGEDLNNVYEHYSSYLQNVQIPNSPGPIEKHPYIELYKDDCDFQRDTLLLGTFPPSSYFNNLPINHFPNPNVQNNNPTHYFYGNMDALWFYLFELEGAEVTIPSIQSLLKENSISISDVFTFIQRKKMNSASDNDLKNIVSNYNLKEIFNSNSKIKTVLFTSGRLSNFLNNNVSTLTGFRWILEECFDGLHHFTISGDINGNGEFYPINNVGIQNSLHQQNGGIIWWLKFGDKKIRIVNLPSPAGGAQMGMMTSSFFKKWMNFKANANGIPLCVEDGNVMEYLNEYPDIFLAPPTIYYRREIYQMFLDDNLHLI